jgi:hypothetical protein
MSSSDIRNGPLPITSICTTTITAVGGELACGFINISLNTRSRRTCPGRKWTAVSVKWAATRAKSRFPSRSITVRQTILTLSKPLENVWNRPLSVWRTCTMGSSLPFPYDHDFSLCDGSNKTSREESFHPGRVVCLIWRGNKALNSHFIIQWKVVLVLKNVLIKLCGSYKKRNVSVY